MIEVEHSRVAAYSRRRRVAKGGRIRALVVDDSVTVRRLVSGALEEDPRIEVIAGAANGVIALRMIPLLHPDLVILDVEMPEMDGLQTLREIRKLYPNLVVIMFSSLTERSAAITIEALSLGADDYVAKTAGCGTVDRSLVRLREDLIPKCKQFFAFGEADFLERRRPASLPRERRQMTARSAVPARKVRCRAVAIGVSTGGPAALAELIPMLPAAFALPVFVVQHMPPMFTRLLAERLQKLTRLHVSEATEGMLVEPGHVYLAPGDYHMRVLRQGHREIISVDQSEPENSCRPAVDVLFRSVADVYGAATVAAVLTGMGHDGLRGVEQLHGLGAYVIAQDEASSVVWGMPGAIVNSGLADSVVDLKSIAAEIERHV